MSSETYDLVFSGELVRGADPAQSRRNLGGLFKISEAKVDALFSGNPVTLKKGLDFATANKYRVAIKKAGCRVDLVEKKVGSTAAAKPAAKEKASFAASEPQSTQASMGAGSTQDTSPQAPPAVVEPERPPLPIVEEVEAAPAPVAAEEHASLSLAPVAGNLVDSNELEHLEPVHVEIGDISIKADGGDLLNDEEKTVFEPLEIDLDAELAPVGSDLLREAEREHVDVVEIDLSEFSVAEPGEDLGQAKDQKEELHPDISHLSLQ